MDILYLSIIGFFLLIVIYLANQSRKHKGQNQIKPTLDYSNIVQKSTILLYFDKQGYLKTSAHLEVENNIFSDLKPGQHISEFKKFKNLDKYFETSKRSKKNIILKLSEDGEDNYAMRHDLIFSPIIMDEEIQSVMLISQELVSKNNEQHHLSNQAELEKQRNYALKQIDEIEAQKSELEIAFKKSSKHHIMLQKAMRQIETQKDELQGAFDIINKQKQSLEKANIEIKESSKMKEIFLANTSHEIRTPLNAIIGFTNLLLNSDLNELQRRYLDNIKSSGNNLLVVINDILDFSKIESGKLTIEQIEFDFRNFIKYTLNTLSAKAQEKNLSLKYDLSPDIPEIIIGDPVRLNQILINLIGNSIKFTNNNGFIRLYATLGQPVGDKIKVLFKVEDNGIGIASNKLRDIFLSFTQGESDTTRKYGGTGLGLSIVKQLITLQDGDITVESEVGKGTSFTFFILLKRGEPKNEPHIKHQKVEKTKSTLEGVKILLVEDNMINQQLAYDTIKSWNKDIVIDLAENGKIALNLIEENDYHLVLMDIQMPEMDGNEATKKIRSLNSEKKNIPIIAMTAHALKNEKENCLKMGMDDYLSKPFDPEDLFAKIQRYAKDKTNVIERVEFEPNQLNHSVEAINFGQTTNNSIDNFEYFNLINLEKIYKKDIEKISKIVDMCFQSIPKEISDVETAYAEGKFDILKNKAHALKPKFGYLGMFEIQESAKNIEILSNDSKEHKQIEFLIGEIKTYWEKAIPELKRFLDIQKK